MAIANDDGDRGPETMTIPRTFPEYAPDNATPLTVPAPTTQLFGNYATDNKVLVKSVAFSGNTVVDDAQLQAVAASFVGRELDSGDIEELRYLLTRLYVDQGYINSGASLDGYDTNTNHLRIRLQEGKLGDIQVQTEGTLRADYVADRLRIAGVAPLHLPALQERFLTLLEDPIIESIRGAIAPSSLPGEANLEVEAIGTRPYTVSLTVDNHGPVSLGEKRVLLNGSLINVTGLGEILNLGFSGSDGNKRGRAGLSIPISAYDTKLHGFFERSNAVVREEGLDLLDIKGEYTAYELGITQPLLNTTQNNFNLGLSLGQRSNKAKLLGIPFCFNQGCSNGRSTTTALRFDQEWSHRSVAQVYNVHSILSFGLDAMGATRTTRGSVDNLFTTWLLQQRYARQWWNRKVQLIGRMDLQLADSALPILEQVAVGGVGTVRGYRENAMVRDQVILGSLELRYSFLDGVTQSTYGRLEGAIFTDFAHGWNRIKPNQTEDLHSIGLGLLWSWRDSLQTQLYWGHQLKIQHLSNTTDWNFQDEGIHFQLQATY